MAKNNPGIPNICVVTRTYGNRQGEGEGVRVKAGTRFAIADSIDGMDMLLSAKRNGSTKEQRIARYKQLLGGRLVAPFDPDTDGAAAPAARPAPAAPARKPEDQKAKRPVEKGAVLKSPLTPGGGKRVTKVDSSPPAPKVIRQASGPAGSPDGKETPASSSQADPASNKSGSKTRGNRKASSGSSSTTPTA